jgi:hypothetical protein
MIRTLVDRIEQLEEQVRSLQEGREVLQESQSLASVCWSSWEESVLQGEALEVPSYRSKQNSCALKDRAIEEFLDGSGI